MPNLQMDSSLKMTLKNLDNSTKHLSSWLITKPEMPMTLCSVLEKQIIFHPSSPKSPPLDHISQSVKSKSKK
jgi:hypothetical protein